LLNILWHSAPIYFPTGYGIQSKYYAILLKEAGHEVSILSTTPTIGHVWNGIMHLPGGEKDAGAAGLYAWPQKFQVDVILTLFDVWTLPEDVGKTLEMMGVKWIAMSPIDHNPIPTRVLKRLLHAPYVVAISPYAKRELERVGLKPTYIPHGVDMEIYKPGDGAKKEIGGIDDNGREKFVIGMVAQNVEPLDRKGWWPTMQAIGKFQAKHKDSVFYAHADPRNLVGGRDLNEMADLAGVNMWNPDHWLLSAGIPDEMMARIYNSFDVYMMLTKAEGFGIPVIEAQACGLPVIVTDTTACSDLIGAGWKIPSIGKVHTPLNSFWEEPDVDKAVEALEEAYDLWKQRKLKETFQNKAIEFAKQFDWPVIRDNHLLPFFERVENDIKKERLEAKKSNERGRQTPFQPPPRGRVHNSKLRQTKSKRSRSRRKKR